MLQGERPWRVIENTCKLVPVNLRCTVEMNWFFTYCIKVKAHQKGVEIYLVQST